MDIRLITEPDTLTTLSDLKQLQRISHDLISNSLVTVIGYLRVIEGLNINPTLQGPLLYISIEPGIVLVDGIPSEVQGTSILIGREVTDIGLIALDGIDSNLEDPNTLYPRGADRVWRRYTISPTLTSIPLFRVVVDEDIVFIHTLHTSSEVVSDAIQQYVRENTLVKGLYPYWIGNELWIAPGVYTYESQLISSPYPTYIGPMDDAELYGDRYGVISVFKDINNRPTYVSSDYAQLTNSLGYRLILDSITNRPVNSRYLYRIEDRRVVDFPLFLNPRLLMDRLKDQQTLIDDLRGKALSLTRSSLTNDSIYYDFTRSAIGDISHPLFTATVTSQGLRPRTELMIGRLDLTKGRNGLLINQTAYVNPDRPTTNEISIPIRESLIPRVDNPVIIQYPSYLVTNNNRLVDRQVLIRIENIPNGNYLVYVDDISIPITSGSTDVTEGVMELVLSLTTLTRIPRRLGLVGSNTTISLPIHTIDIYNPRPSHTALPSSMTIPLSISKSTYISELVLVSQTVPKLIPSNPTIGRLGIYDSTNALLSMFHINSRDLNTGASIFNLDRVVQLLPGNYRLTISMYKPGWVLSGIRYRTITPSPERYEFRLTYPNTPNILIDILNEGLVANGGALELATDKTNTFSIERLPYALDLSFNRIIGLTYTDSTWISEELDGLDYSRVYLLVECQLNGGQITPYVSSDGGITWLPMRSSVSRVLNEDIDQRELSYIIDNLSAIVQQVTPSGDTNTIPRNRLRVRLDIKVGDIKSPPLIQRLGAYTSI
jgi:hypothetical protein